MRCAPPAVDSFVNAPGVRVPPITWYRHLYPVQLEPTNIQQIGDELAIAWSDGAESAILHVRT
jgi:hypothetical protein